MKGSYLSLFELYSTPSLETYFLWTSPSFLSLITLIPFVCITTLLLLNRCNYALRGTKTHLSYYILKCNHFVRPITQQETSRYVHDNLLHVDLQHLKKFRSYSIDSFLQCYLNVSCANEKWQMVSKWLSNGVYLIY